MVSWREADDALQNIRRRKEVSRSADSLKCANSARLGPSHTGEGILTLRHSILSYLVVPMMGAGLFLASRDETSASVLDQLSDLSGKASVTVTLTGRDNFNSEYRYDLTVRNGSSDPLIADSLIIVLDKITNLAGEDREPLKSETFLTRFEVLGQDGETEDGRPFFRVPVGASQDLAPLTNSLPVSIRIRNKDYVAVFTPAFRVYGKKRPPAEAKLQPASPLPAQSTNQTDKLIQLLLKKGIITEEEWRKAIQP